MKKGIIFFVFCLVYFMGSFYNISFANNSEDVKINWNDFQTSSLVDKKNLQKALSLDFNKSYDLNDNFNLSDIKIENDSQYRIVNYQNILYVYQNKQGKINKIVIKNFGGIRLYNMALGLCLNDNPLTYNQYFINEYINDKGDVCKKYKSSNRNITYIAVFHRPNPRMNPLFLEIQIFLNN